MTKFLFTNSGMYEDIQKYAKTIEDKTGMKINYDDNDGYYYVINSLTTLLKIVNILDKVAGDTGIIISRAYKDDNTYVIEVYDDWRE